MMLLTERDTQRGTLVTVCDEGLVGHTFEDDEVSLTVNEEFYGGDAADEDAVRRALARAEVGNLVGEEAVALAIDCGVVAEPNVLDVDGTRHAQFLRL